MAFCRFVLYRTPLWSGCYFLCCPPPHIQQLTIFGNSYMPVVLLLLGFQIWRWVALVCGGSDVFSPNQEEPERASFHPQSDPDPDLYANTHPTSGHHLPHISNKPPIQYCEIECFDQPSDMVLVRFLVKKTLARKKLLFWEL